MQFQNEKDKILIIDFGSQVTKLIARRVRELGVYSEIITPNELNKKLKSICSKFCIKSDKLKIEIENLSKK